MTISYISLLSVRSALDWCRFYRDTGAVGYFAWACGKPTASMHGSTLCCKGTPNL